MRCRGMEWIGCLCLAMSLGCGGTSDSKPRTGDGGESRAAASDSSLLPVPSQDDGKAAIAEKAFSGLLAASHDANPDAWAAAEKELTDLGGAAASTLAKHLKDDDPLARELAVQYLAQLGPDAAEAAEELVAALNDSSPMVRVNAAATLLALNASVDAAQSVLSELLASEDPTVRLPAAISLSSIEATTAEAIATLTDLLTASDSSIRRTAVETLGRLGDKATASLGAVKELASDGDSAVRRAAAEAARRIESGTDSTSETIPAGGVEE